MIEEVLSVLVFIVFLIVASSPIGVTLVFTFPIWGSALVFNLMKRKMT